MLAHPSSGWRRCPTRLVWPRPRATPTPREACSTGSPARRWARCRGCRRGKRPAMADYRRSWPRRRRSTSSGAANNTLRYATVGRRAGLAQSSRVDLVPRWLAIGLGVALALPLAVYASVGSFARYTADDYCWAGVLRTEGFFGAQVQWYTIYSPRYAFTFVVNVVELAGPAIVPALPIAAILVWLATLTWTFIQFGIKSLPALLLAELTALATLQTAPDLPQSLYWQTGMLTYLLPLILATFLLGWIRRATASDRLSYPALTLCALTTFVAGGLSETYLIPQNVALTLALLACAV